MCVCVCVFLFNPNTKEFCHHLKIVCDSLLRKDEATNDNVKLPAIFLVPIWPDIVSFVHDQMIRKLPLLRLCQ